MRRSRALQILAGALAILASLAWFFIKEEGSTAVRIESKREQAARPNAPEVSDAPKLQDGPARVIVPTQPESADRSTKPRAPRLRVHVVDPTTGKSWCGVKVTLEELRIADTETSSPMYIVFGDRDRETDANGEAVFDELARSHYRVHVLGPKAFGDIVEIDPPDDADSSLELKAWRAADLKGRVADETGTPVSNCKVEVRLPHKVQTITGNEDGTFLFTNLDVGERGATGIVIEVRARSPLWLEGDIRSVEVQSGDNEIAMPLVLRRRAGSLRGRIVDALGVSLRGVEVDCPTLQLNSNSSGKTRTDDQGRFRFGSLESGRYVIACAAICVAATSPIDVGSGADVDVGDLKPPPERFDVTGVAVFSDGRPAVGASVRFGETTTVLGADGSFTFSRCSNARGDLAFSWDDADDLVCWQQIETNVLPGAAPLHIVLVPRGAVFRVIDATSRAPLTNAHLEVIARAATGASTSADFDSRQGEFRMGIDEMPQPVTLRVVVKGYRAFEMIYERPKDGYADRHIVEVPLERP